MSDNAQFCEVATIPLHFSSKPYTFKSIGLHLSEIGTILKTIDSPSETTSKSTSNATTPGSLFSHPSFLPFENFQITKIGKITINAGQDITSIQKTLLTQINETDGGRVLIEVAKPLENLSDFKSPNKKQSTTNNKNTDFNTLKKIRVRSVKNVRKQRNDGRERNDGNREQRSDEQILLTPQKSISSIDLRSEVPDGWRTETDWMDRPIYKHSGTNFSTLDYAQMKSTPMRHKSIGGYEARANFTENSNLELEKTNLDRQIPKFGTLSAAPTNYLQRCRRSFRNIRSESRRPTVDKVFDGMKNLVEDGIEEVTPEDQSVEVLTQITNLDEISILGENDSELTKKVTPSRFHREMLTTTDASPTPELDLGQELYIDDISNLQATLTRNKPDCSLPDASKIPRFSSSTLGISRSHSLPHKPRQNSESNSRFVSQQLETTENVSTSTPKTNMFSKKLATQLRSDIDSTPMKQAPIVTVKDVHTFAFKLLLKTSLNHLLRLHNDVNSITRENQQLLRIAVEQIKTKPKETTESDDKYGRQFFDSYIHWPILYNFVNSFSEKRDVPTGWTREISELKGTYYLDHLSKQSTFLNPNIMNFDVKNAETQQKDYNQDLGVENKTPNEITTTPENSRISENREISENQPENRLEAQSASQPSAQSSNESEELAAEDILTDAERNIMFFQSEEVYDIIHENVPDFQQSQFLVSTVEKIRTQGITAYNRVINGHRNFEFVMFISSLADAIDNFSIARATGLVEDSRLAAASTQRRKATNKNSVLEEKITKFYEELEKRGYAGSRQQLCLTNVPRVNIANSVCRAINKAPAHILQKCKMKVTFDSEEGLDFSGPLREMFYLVSKETFDPYRGYFKYASDNQYTVAVASQICSPNGELDSETKAWFRFSGRLIGLALLHRVLLDVYFVRSFYRALLKQSYKLEDLKSMDEEFYNSMSWILKNEIDDKYLCMTFEADTEIFGQLITRELKPGGTEIDVTDANKIEYTELLIKWRTDLGTKEAMDEICAGFGDVLPIELVKKYFDAKELELALCGIADLDITDWKKNTEYRNNYTAEHKSVKLFWEVLDKDFTNDERLKLLQFVTGSTSLPFEGFRGLRGPNGKKPFCIQKWGELGDLPRSHTCFNRIDLPAYTSRKQMKSKLLYAINETEGFAIE